MVYNYGQIFVAEIVGTFILVFIGNGGVANALLPGTKGHGIGFLGISFTFGWGVFLAVQFLGHVSGFFNPAVVLAAAVIGKATWTQMWVCWAGEMVGGTLGGVVVWFTYLPHFQSLQVMVMENRELCANCDMDVGRVAVIPQLIKGSARRFASGGNKIPKKGIKLRINQSESAIHEWLKLAVEKLRLCSNGNENEVDNKKQYISPHEITQIQQSPSLHRCPPTIDQHVAEDQEIKLSVFCTRPSVMKRYWIYGLWAEFLGTGILTYGAFTIGDRKEMFITDASVQSMFANGFEPLLIGLLVFGLILAIGGITGPALNPARDLGPRLVHWLVPIPGKGSSEWWYSWVPVVGPCGGAVVGALFGEQMRLMMKSGI